MIERKRHIASLLGLLFLISEGYAQSDANRPSAQTENQPSPPAPISIQQQQTPADYYEISCERPKDHDAADLCEQRRMAQAAEDSVWWARVQAWLGGLGFGGILITLIFTGLGTRVAARQVRLSRHALVDTERAFVYPADTEWAALKDHKTGKVQSWSVAVQWKNSGGTPTRHLQIHTNASVRDAILPDDFDFPDFGSGNIGLFIAPGSTIRSIQIAITLEGMEEIIAGKKHLYTWGWAEYDDVFEQTRRHRTEFCYKWEIGGNPRDPDKISFRSATHDRYNGADDECENPLRTASPKDMGKR
jgi:hypothetical protein